MLTHSFFLGSGNLCRLCCGLGDRGGQKHVGTAIAQISYLLVFWMEGQIYCVLFGRSVVYLPVKFSLIVDPPLPPYFFKTFPRVLMWSTMDSKFNRALSIHFEGLI